MAGVFGDPEAARLVYLALHALQHRGQEGAGIVAARDGTLRLVSGLGLVADVFNEEKLAGLGGTTAVGHTRYATTGESALRNVQPFLVTWRHGQVAIAHNGNLVNAARLRAELEDRGSIFSSSSDTEVILHLVAASTQTTFVNRLVDALMRVEGAYSLLVMTPERLVAVRDPLGFRPLVMGRRGHATVFASETGAFDLIDGELVREVAPGEMVIADADGVTSISPFPRRGRKACVFEHVYFSRADSLTFGRSVYASRYRAGRALAQAAPAVADVVIPVPDSGTPAALGFSHASGIPFQLGLVKSPYVGRTFIEPEQQIRDFGVKLKLTPVREVLAGRRVVVVDDSMVRGTTSRKIVRLLKEAGATEVHLRVASPPVIGSCYYGVDTPDREELIAHRLSSDEVRSYVDADSLKWLPIEALRADLEDGASTWCDACFSGEYPVPPEQEVPRPQLDLFLSPHKS